MIMARSKDIKIQSVFGATIDGADIQEHRILLHPDSPFVKFRSQKFYHKIFFYQEPLHTFFIEKTVIK